ncbi:MAG: rhodanese-like domain-containing protein [Tessaracoccus sp.]
MAATRTITADELAATRSRVVDVRSREEYAIAHIPGSLNIPLDDISSRLKDLPNTTLYLLCGPAQQPGRNKSSRTTVTRP